MTTAPTSAIAPHVSPEIATFHQFVNGAAVAQRLKDVASKYMKPDEIMRCMLVAASRNAEIAKCTQASVLRCMMEASALGIRPGGLLGRGYLVPRWNSKIGAMELNLDPGYRGLADIAKRSGKVIKIEADVVHKMDKFREIRGTEPRLVHEPYDGEEDPGPMTHAYAVAFYENGATQFDVLPLREIDKAKAVSQSRDRQGNLVGPWADWPEEMAKKTAIRRLCKALPYDEELEYAIEVATRAEMPAVSVDLPSEPVATEPTRPDAIAGRIRERRGGRAVPAEDSAAGGKSVPAEPAANPGNAPGVRETGTSPASAGGAAKRDGGESTPSTLAEDVKVTFAGQAMGPPADGAPVAISRNLAKEGDVLWQRIDAATTLDALTVIADDLDAFERAGGPLVKAIRNHLAEKKAKFEPPADVPAPAAAATNWPQEEKRMENNIRMAYAKGAHESDREEVTRIVETFLKGCPAAVASRVVRIHRLAKEGKLPPPEPFG